jgi:hypothetical protein
MSHPRTLAAFLFALAPLVLGAPGYSGDAPEISRSRGAAGGVVVLWTRVIPGSEDASLQGAAGAVQEALRAAAAQAAPGATVDVRPAPERVCPREGCKAVAVGAVLAHKDGGCVVVATVSAPGESAAKLIPLAGKVKLKADSAPFREPPESFVQVLDFASCADVAAQLDTSALAAALSEAGAR